MPPPPSSRGDGALNGGARRSRHQSARTPMLYSRGCSGRRGRGRSFGLPSFLFMRRVRAAHPGGPLLRGRGRGMERARARAAEPSSRALRVLRALRVADGPARAEPAVLRTAAIPEVVPARAAAHREAARRREARPRPEARRLRRPARSASTRRPRRSLRRKRSACPRSSRARRSTAPSTARCRHSTRPSTRSRSASSVRCACVPAPT